MGGGGGFPLPGGVTPTLPTQDQNSLDNVLKSLQKSGVFANMMNNIAQRNEEPKSSLQTPGVVGGAPPNVASAPPQAAMPTGGGMPTPASSMAGSPPMTPSAQPSLGGAGFYAPNRRAAKQMTAYDVIQTITGLANQQKQAKFKREQSEYEYLLREYFDARSRGDNQLANSIVSDKRFQKMAKDIGSYVPLEVKQNEQTPAVAAMNKVSGEIAQQQNQKQQQGQQPPQQGQQQQRPGMMQQVGGALKNMGQNALGAVTGGRLGGGQQLPPRGPMQVGGNQASPQQLQQAAQNLINGSPKELQDSMASLWQVYSMQPGGAQQGLQEMAKARIQYQQLEAQMGSKIAIDNANNATKIAIDNATNQNKAQMEMFKDIIDQSQMDDRAKTAAKAKIDAANIAAKSRVDAAQVAADAKKATQGAMKPLTPAQQQKVQTGLVGINNAEASIDKALANIDSIKGNVLSGPLKTLQTATSNLPSGLNFENKSQRDLLSAMQGLREQINIVRQPYGSTGFRNAPALEALWNYTGSGNWWKDPELTRTRLTEARADLEKLKGSYNDSLKQGAPQGGSQDGFGAMLDQYLTGK